MKKYLYILILFSVLLTGKVFAQNVEVIQEETRTTSYQNKSYLVVKGLTIKPPSGGEFKFTATSTSSFFIRVVEAAKITNVPPSLDQNFVRTESVQIPSVTNENALSGLSVDQKNTSYSYVDGLGRNLQSVTVQGSPTKIDVIQPVSYDQYGRQALEYLPYTNATQDGRYHSTAATLVTGEQALFYKTPPAGIKDDQRPYKENIFENSPLSRVTNVYGPGTDWKSETVDKKVSSLEKVNLQSENIIRWKPFVSGYPEKNGIYSNNQLSVQETINEDGQINRSYKNLLGQQVLSRVGDGTAWFDTYYIFSPANLLMVVIQPEGVDRLSNEFDAVGADKQSFLNRWCFQYDYDSEQRLVAKRIPGWAPGYWGYTVYDKWNRVVFTQSPSQKEKNQWTFSKYDRFNREIMMGLYSSSSDRTTLQSNLDSHYSNNPTFRFETETADATGYTQNKCFPVSVAESSLITVTYYDNYNFLTNSGWTSGSYNYNSLTGFLQYSDILTAVKGYVTGSKVRVLDQSTWLKSVTRYDKKYRIAQVIVDNYVGGRDYITSQYDFTGRALKTQSNHSSNLGTLAILREFEYDHTGRLKNLFQTTGTGPRVLLSSSKYNETGQLIEKNIHSTDGGSSFLQSIDMRYNIRGWLSHINNSSLSNDGSTNNDSNDLFGMEFLYNPSTSPSISGYPGGMVPKRYDGNITAIKWKTDTRQGGSVEERIYGFNYDALSRLNKAYYATNAAAAWTGNAGLFNEEIKGYDKNGNITGIIRKGKINGDASEIDNTMYGYNYSGSMSNFSGFGNRLLSISDGGNSYGFKDGATQISEEFRYDAGGNLIFDQNKGISEIEYNHLNLPKRIDFTRTDGTVDRIEYSYDAKGNKLRTIVNVNNTPVSQIDYVGEIEYDNGQMFAATPEGRVVKNNSDFDYEYFYKDHQGNIRLTYGSLKETLSYRATMENPASPSTLGSDENGVFKNVTSTRYQQVSPQKFNYTRSSDQVLDPNASSKTNAFLGKPIGMAKSLHLASGDKVSMEVYAKYSETSGGSATMATTAFIQALATTTFGFATGESGFASFNSNAPVVAGAGNASQTLPKAYLAYLFFNESFGFVTSGAVSVSTSAFESFEKLQRGFIAPQAGYLYVYVANETYTGATTGNVYFDEMLIVHQKSNSVLQVTQASDYYPFGLQFNSYNQDRKVIVPPPVGPFGDPDAPSPPQVLKSPTNYFGFQGQEWQKDLDLGWSQFKWRMHDPAIGRFGSVDPLADEYMHNSTYAFSENKVVGHIELEGLEAFSTKIDANGQPQSYATQDATAGSSAAPREFKRQDPPWPHYTLGHGSSSIYHPNAFTSFERAGHLGVDIAGAVEGIYAIKTLAKNIPRLLKYYKSLDEVGEGVSALKQLDDFDSPNIVAPLGDLGRQMPSITVDVKVSANLKQFANIPGVYIHEFQSGTVYVGQAKNLAERPLSSLKELLDLTKKGTAVKQGDVYTGTSYFYKLQDSGLGTLRDLENFLLQSYGGTIKQGGTTYNIRRVPGF